jgi:hypothetical protein
MYFEESNIWVVHRARTERRVYELEFARWQKRTPKSIRVE